MGLLPDGERLKQLMSILNQRNPYCFLMSTGNYNYYLTHSGIESDDSYGMLAGVQIVSLKDVPDDDLIIFYSHETFMFYAKMWKKYGHKKALEMTIQKFSQEDLVKKAVKRSEIFKN